MKTVFFTICDSQIQKNATNARNLDFNGFVKSFMRFHNGIELIIYDEKDMAKHGVNYYNAKAIFGKLLSKDYDLVVNIDADHYAFARFDEILSGDYDVACPANFNETNNLVGIKVSSGITGEANKGWLIDEKEYLQGGLIASTSKEFWKHYEYAALKYWNHFHCRENDVLNLVAYLSPYKLKILDGSTDFNSPQKTSWYGCSIINKESKCVVESNKIMCEGKPVVAYHFAHGSGKKKYTDVFPEHTHSFIQSIIN